MAGPVDPITGKLRFGGYPESTTGVQDYETLPNQDFTFTDNEVLYFGDDNDASMKWDGSVLEILPLTDDTGALNVGDGTTDMDLKVFLGSTADYFECNVGSKRVNIVRGATAITGEEHTLDITDGGTLSSGDSLVGVNVAITPVGSSGAWVSAFYGKVTEVAAAPGPVSGYLCGAEFEVVLTGSQPSAWAVLVLNSSASNSTHGQSEAYIGLREYGSLANQNLFWFGDTTRASASNSVIVSAVGSVTGRAPYDTAIRFLIGTTPYWLLASSTGPATIADEKIMGSVAGNYLEWDASADSLKLIGGTVTGSSEHDIADFEVTSDNTYLTGNNLTYSGARGSAILKLVGTASMASGGFEGIDIKIASSGAFTTDGNGVMGVKCVVTNSAAMTDGEMYGGQFIAKHSHASNIMTASASLIGLEAWAYVASTGVARTCIGGNFGWHNEATGATFGAGSVIRGIQVFCDNASGAGTPVESTGICIWNQAGAITNVLNVVNSGSGFTNFVTFTDDGAPASLTNGSTLNDISATANEGWIKVTLGTTVRYIALYAAKS